MKRFLFIAVVSALIAMPAVANLSVNYGFVDSATHDLSSPYWTLPGFTVDTFDAATPLGWTYVAGGSAGIVAAPHPNTDGATYAAPWDGEGVTGYDSTGFLSLPRAAGLNTGSGTVYTQMVTFGVDNLRYLGLHWGSEDNFNSIAFYKGGLQVPGNVITGSDVNGNGNGTQNNALSNRYVNIFTDFDFDAIQLRSLDDNTGGTISPYAFELDNLSVAVPVPGAVLLGILGLSAAGIKLRRRM